MGFGIQAAENDVVQVQTLNGEIYQYIHSFGLHNSSYMGTILDLVTANLERGIFSILSCEALEGAFFSFLPGHGTTTSLEQGNLPILCQLTYTRLG